MNRNEDKTRTPKNELYLNRTRVKIIVMTLEQNERNNEEWILFIVFFRRELIEWDLFDLVLDRRGWSVCLPVSIRSFSFDGWSLRQHTRDTTAH